jgi:hypothetical protein
MLNGSSSYSFIQPSPGAVESRDSIAIILGMLEKLHHIVSSDDTNGNVAGGNHFG